MADAQKTLLVSGSGDVVEPEDGVLALGSGGGYARALRLRALLAETDLPADEVVRRSLEIAADICVYTNTEILIDTLKATPDKA